MQRLGSLAAVSLALLLPLLLPLAGLAGCSGAPPDGSPPAPVTEQAAQARRADAGRSTPHRRVEPRAVAVLHAWDRRRGAAWAAQDPAALRRLYLPGSRAGERDVALLSRYVARRVEVPDLRMQVWRAQVLVQQPDRVVVRVAERLATTRVRWAGAVVHLPQDRLQVRVVELRRTRSGWRVASVSRGRS